jgi:hypothetical protein
MIRQSPVAVLLCLVVAGCVGASGQKDAASDQSRGGLASITGTIVNEELFPLLDANVNVTGKAPGAVGQTVVADAKGSFHVGGLAAGSYVVNATSAAYYPKPTKVDLAAGEAKQITIVLTVRPAREPYVIVAPWAGFNTCGLALVVTPANMCGTSGDRNVDMVVDNVTKITSGGSSRTGRNYTIYDGFTAIVGETVWKGSDEASSYYYNQSMENKQYNETKNAFSAIMNLSQGKSPLRVVMPAGSKRAATIGVFNGDYQKVSEGGSFLMRYGMWWNGYYGDLFGPAGPVCTQFAVPKCTGVGATINFRFTHWISIFMYQKPADLEHYSVAPDA